MSVDEPGWWLDAPFHIPQQGDVLAVLPLARSAVPFQTLRKQSVKNGHAWFEIPTPTETSGHLFALARGKNTHAVILSHDCEMDKERRKRRIHLAPLLPLSTLGDKERVKVLAQKTLKSLPLPGIPGLGDYYADLLSMIVVDYETLDWCPRIASMTPDGVLRLQAQLVSFFTRKDFTKELRQAPDLPEGAPEDSPELPAP